MASQLGGLIRDQSLNVHYNGASAGGKSNVSKVPRKGVGRKPLGDLSNSVMPTPNQSLKKQNSNIFSFTEKDIGASKSKIALNGSKNESKAHEKIQTSARKGLSDISNSGKLHLAEAQKKNLNAKLSVVAEEHLSAITEEGLIHNHRECIEARSKAMDTDEFLRTVGLDKGFPKQSVPPQPSKSVPASPPRCLELPELEFEDRYPRKCEHFSDDLDSPPPCKTPKSPNHYMPSKDLDHVNFMLSR